MSAFFAAIPITMYFSDAYRGQRNPSSSAAVEDSLTSLTLFNR